MARTPAQETVFRAAQHRLKGFPAQGPELGSAESICGKLRTALIGQKHLQKPERLPGWAMWAAAEPKGREAVSAWFLRSGNSAELSAPGSPRRVLSSWQDEK